MHSGALAGPDNYRERYAPIYFNKILKEGCKYNLFL